MLKFALKNMAIKKTQIILVLISIIISASVGVLAFNISSQVSDGITSNAGYYSLIVGPAGSKTQLAMNSMYFTEEPVGTIPYSVYSDIKRDQRVTSAIPFAMADNYKGSSVVGTTSAYLEGKALKEGTLFDDNATMQAVIGARVAKEHGLSIGSELFTSHSAIEGSEHTTPIIVVGILEETYSAFDRVVFTEIETLWDMHNHEEHEEDEEHHHEHATICAVLVNTKNPSYAMQMVNEYDDMIYTHDEESCTLQAIEPMQIVRDVLSDADDTKYIVFVLCAIILIMNVIIISIITLLNMYHSAKEISLMRLIGISMKKINLLYLIQNGIIGALSVIIAFAVSRLCLALAGDYVASMGVVLNVGKVYLPEIFILLGVFLISVIPTIICTFVMAKRDSLAE